MMLHVPGLGQTVTARLTNLTHAGSADLFVGDEWLLQVAGPANKSVSVAARQNGGAWSVSTYGQTSANGIYELRGKMGGEHVGRWEEFWKVDGTEAPILAFNVKLPPPPPVPLPPPLVTQPAPLPGNVKTSPLIVRGGGEPSGGGLDFLTEPGLFGLPNWVPLAGAAIFLMKGRR